jgi:hypothetical protein
MVLYARDGIRCGLPVAAILLLGLLWLANARQVSQLIDTVATVRVARFSPSPFGWNGTSFQLAAGQPHGAAGRAAARDRPGITDLTGPAPLYVSAAQVAVNAVGMLAGGLQPLPSRRRQNEKAALAGWVMLNGSRKRRC